MRARSFTEFIVFYVTLTLSFLGELLHDIRIAVALAAGTALLVWLASEVVVGPW